RTVPPRDAAMCALACERTGFPGSPDGSLGLRSVAGQRTGCQAGPVVDRAVAKSTVLDSETFYYTGLDLDRAGSSRSDAAWLQARRAPPDLRIIPLWSDNCLVRSGRPVVLTADQAAGLEPAQPVFLGISASGPVFAADLSGLDRAGALALA